MNRNGYVPLPFLKPLPRGFALKREVTVVLMTHCATAMSAIITESEVGLGLGRICRLLEQSWS